MRYAVDQKQKTHERIVAEAARLFRSRGYHACGVDAVMKAVGLTAGGFYSHFKNKGALFAEVLEHCAINTSSSRPNSQQADGDPLRTWLDQYLSLVHLDGPGTGCPVPALASEVSRQPRVVRASFTTFLRRRIDKLTTRIPKERRAVRGDVAIAVLASAAGAMALARAVDDRELSERILRATHAAICEYATALRRKPKQPRRAKLPRRTND